MEISEEDVKTIRDINLDTAGFNVEGKTGDDRHRRQEKIKSVSQLKNEIIQTRIAAHDYGLSRIEAQIRALQDERTAIIFGATAKKDFLAKTLEIVHARKQEALNKLLFAPLSVSKENNFLPLMHAMSGRSTFKESDLWDLFFLSIDDKDIKAVIEQMPETGLTMAERQTRIDEINAEIEKLTGSLNDELATAKKELSDRHSMEALDRADQG